MGCTHSKVSPSIADNQKVHKKGRPKSVKFWTRILRRGNSKVHPIADLDSFQMNLTKKVRPTSAPKNISLDIYYPDPEDISDDDTPASRPSTSWSWRSHQDVTKDDVTKHTGRKAVNMLKHLAKKGIFTANVKKSPEPQLDCLRGAAAFEVKLDGRPPLIPNHPLRLSKRGKKKSQKEIKEKLEAASERRQSQTHQKLERIRLKSARADKVREVLRSMDKALEEAGVELTQKMDGADERRQKIASQKHQRLRQKSAKVREVQDAIAEANAAKQKEREEKLRQKLEKSTQQREKIEKAKMMRIKSATKERWTERKWNNTMKKVADRAEKARQERERAQAEISDEEVDGNISDIETFRGSSSDESLDAFFSQGGGHTTSPI